MSIFVGLRNIDFMKLKHILAFSLLLVSPLMSGAEPQMSPEKAYRAALTLYSDGNYSTARALFESVEDPLCDAYAVLCAARQKDPALPLLLDAYFGTHASSVLDSELHFRYGLVLFDAGSFAKAAAEFAKVKEKRLSKADAVQLKFKSAYCQYELGDNVNAARGFAEISAMPYTDYTPAARYYLGYIAYQDRKPGEAASWFEKSIEDSRFEEMSRFYLVECHFMEKDYDYVVTKGAEAVETMPRDRAARLARMVSEAYMIKGDARKAKEYYEREHSEKNEMTRSDFFHAGSVLYGTGDYAGAVEAFGKMGEMKDSLGQIASYQLGYAHIKKGNKVAAMEAFNNAASLKWSDAIREDAAFNYAKLVFDINHNTSGFDAYIAEYSTSRKGEMIYNYMAIAELYNRNWQAAIDAYDKIDVLTSDQKGNYVKANYLRASELVRVGSWSKSIPYLRAAGFHYPKSDTFNQLSRYWLAEAYYNTGAYQDAANIYTDLYNTSALRSGREGELVPYNAAYSYLMQSNYSVAAKWFDVYLQSGSGAAGRDALARRADCDFRQGQYAAAASRYKKLGEVYPEADYIYPYYREGICYGLTGNRSAEIKALSRVKNAPVTAPYYSETMYELGRAYLDNNENDAAIEAFNLLKSNASDTTFVARAHIGIGMACRNRKKYDDALQNYKQVVTLLPDGEYAKDALLAIESIYQTIGHPEEYLAYVESSKLITGKSEAEREQIYFNTAEQVFLAGNRAGALDLFERYLKDYPSSPNKGKATFYMAESYLSAGDKERAYELYGKVPDLLPSDSFAEISFMRCGQLGYELEHFKESYSSWEKLESASKMEENRKLARVGMMRSAYRSGDYDNAVKVSALVEIDAVADSAQLREAVYVRAKSLLSTSRRSEAVKLFERLSAQPSTVEGAEAVYVLVQNTYDSGDFAGVEPKVYDFASKCGTQSYWLAKCYLVLGDSFAERGNLKQAKATFESLRDGYASSGETDDIQTNVKLRLDKLNSLL